MDEPVHPLSCLAPGGCRPVEYLRVYIRQLRKKLEEDSDHPRIIRNEPGIGYIFMAEE